MERIFEYTVTDEYDGANIKTVLKQYYHMSTALIKSLKTSENGIIANGNRQHVNFILHKNDRLTLTIHEERSEMIEPVKTDFGIVYEDEDIMIINKPAGIPTHPSIGHFENTLANGLMYYFLQKGEERTFHAVNRLDKDTSGILCIAKNRYAHNLLCESLHKDFERKYSAIAEGCITESGTICAPIGRCGDGIIKRCITKDGQYALTHYRPLKNFDSYTLVELHLETGRTHQIRLHMSHIGHPLLGDWLYGTEDKSLFARTALHSSYIRLVHPISKKTMEFTAPLPQDMSDFLIKRNNLQTSL